MPLLSNSVFNADGSFVLTAAAFLSATLAKRFDLVGATTSLATAGVAAVELFAGAAGGLAADGLSAGGLFTLVALHLKKQKHNTTKIELAVNRILFVISGRLEESDRRLIGGFITLFFKLYILIHYNVANCLLFYTGYRS